MNFLALAQKLANESGTIQDGLLTTVVGQTGRKGRICRYINDAWVAVQVAHQDWRWMQSEFLLTSVASQARYAATDAAIVDTLTSAAIDRFRSWVYNPRPEEDSDITLYANSIGVNDEGALLFRDWDWFYKSMLRGTQDEGRPTHFSISPQNSLVFSRTPDSTDYRVKGRYLRSAQNLVADIDIPEMPVDYHDVLVDIGMLMLETFDENPSKITMKLLQRSARFVALEINQLPQVALPDALA